MKPVKVGQRKTTSRHSRQLTTPIAVTSDVLTPAGGLDYRVADTRSKLVEVLASSAWAKGPPETVEEWKSVCAKLGVHPQLLQDAVVVFRTVSPENRETRKRGRFHMRLPEDLRKLLYSWCRERGWKPSVVVQSLLHEYLLGTREPKPHHDAQGKRLHSKFRTGPDIRSRIFDFPLTFAAEQVLARRGVATGVPRSAIVKGMIVGLVTGAWPPPKRIYSMRDQQHASNGYLVPDAIRSSAQSRSAQTLAKEASMSAKEPRSTGNTTCPLATKQPTYSPSDSDDAAPDDLAEEGHEITAAAPVPGTETSDLAADRRAWPAPLLASVLARTVPTRTAGITARETPLGGSTGRP